MTKPIKYERLLLLGLGAVASAYLPALIIPKDPTKQATNFFVKNPIILPLLKVGVGVLAQTVEEEMVGDIGLGMLANGASGLLKGFMNDDRIGSQNGMLPPPPTSSYLPNYVKIAAEMPYQDEVRFDDVVYPSEHENKPEGQGIIKL